MKTLKTVTIRGSITFKASEDRHQELLKSFRRAVKMWAAVKGVSLVSGTPESQMLVPHKTTAAQKLRIPGIAAAMRDAGIPENQVQTAETVGAYDQDVFNAMALWMDAGSDGRQGLLENLQRNLDAYILVGGF